MSWPREVEGFVVLLGMGCIRIAGLYSLHISMNFTTLGNRNRLNISFKDQALSLA